MFCIIAQLSPDGEVDRGGVTEIPVISFNAAVDKTRSL